MSEKRRVTGAELAANARAWAERPSDRRVVEAYLDAWLPAMEAASRRGNLSIREDELPTLRNGATDADMRDVGRELERLGIRLVWDRPLVGPCGMVRYWDWSAKLGPEKGGD